MTIEQLIQAAIVAEWWLAEQRGKDILPEPVSLPLELPEPTDDE